MKKIFIILFATGFLFAKCQNKIVSADWEEGDVLQNVFSKHSLCTPHAGTITDSIARTGKKCVRFELRATDTNCAGSKRAELYIHHKMAAKEKYTWYAWSEFLPGDYPFDKINEVHFQLHDKTGQGPPLIGFWVSEDRWKLIQTYDTIDVNNKNHSMKKHDLGPVLKGQWVDWVLHVNFSLENDGLIQMWRNDSLVLEVKGANFNRENGLAMESPYMKFGIYKWRWKDNPGPFNPDTRVTYVDNMRMGQEGFSIKDFIIKEKKK